MSEDEIIKALLERRNGNVGRLYATPDEWFELNAIRKAQETMELRRKGQDASSVPIDSVTIKYPLADGSILIISNPKYKDHQWQSETQPK